MDLDAPPAELTVLITAHNEAERIDACLRAILAQDYPMERVEILLVDDRSSDGTAARAHAVGGDRLRILRQDAPPPGLTARQGALHLGLEHARGDIVLVTDAGGRVPREWIRELAGHLGPRDGAATGPVVFAGERPLLARCQTLAAVTVLSLFRLLDRHGMAGGLFGANMALRRSAYGAIGGFPAVGWALSEDFALGAALRRAGWSVRYLTEPAVLKPISAGWGQWLARCRRRLVSLPRPLGKLLAGAVTLHWLLLAIGWWGGGWWWLPAVVRYAAGVGLLTLWADQYGARWLWPAALVVEPIAMVLIPVLWVANAVVPRWRWGGLTHERPARQRPNL